MRISRNQLCNLRLGIQITRFREWGQGHETVCHYCFSCTH
jgi:hypothetical protein